MLVEPWSCLSFSLLLPNSFLVLSALGATPADSPDSAEGRSHDPRGGGIAWALGLKILCDGIWAGHEARKELCELALKVICVINLPGSSLCCGKQPGLLQ